MTVQSGTVKWFSSEKGFGFIVPEGGGKELFAHANDVLTGPASLTENQRVEFEVVQGRKGPQASSIRAV